MEMELLQHLYKALFFSSSKYSVSVKSRVTSQCVVVCFWCLRKSCTSEGSVNVPENGGMSGCCSSPVAALRWAVSSQDMFISCN